MPGCMDSKQNGQEGLKMQAHTDELLKGLQYKGKSPTWQQPQGESSGQKMTIFKII